MGVHVARIPPNALFINQTILSTFYGKDNVRHAKVNRRTPAQL